MPPRSFRSELRPRSSSTTPTRSSPVAAQGSWLEDVDGNRYVDFNMGYGALFAGHGHPVMRAAIEEQLANGTLFVTPSELNADVAELLVERFGFDLVRFTNSGTESTMDAIRVPRGVHRALEDHQGRGRLPRSPRRGDGVDEAAARPRRSR